MEASASVVEEGWIFLGIRMDASEHRLTLTRSQANLIRTELEYAIKEASNA